MFERFTESARRVLFFARYEVSQIGGLTIEPEHVLLGLLRDNKVIHRILDLSHILATESVRRELGARDGAQKVSTSVEIPFSEATKRVLQFAAEEADRLNHRHIGPEHLLLGVLREEHSPAASILGSHGVRLDDVREAVAKLSPGLATSSMGADAFAEIEQIRQLVGQLAALASTGSEADALVNRIHEALERLKQNL